MKANSPLAFFVLLIAGAQIGVAADFQITKITKNLIATPDFNYGGAGQYRINQRDRWLEVEVEFVAVPDWTDESRSNGQIDPQHQSQRWISDHRLGGISRGSARRIGIGGLSL